MDRRRFRPSAEGLEGRTLLAVNISNLFGFQVNTNLNIPITYQQKALRIKRLPYYLEKILPGRFLPKPELAQIQASLNEMMSSIHKPPGKALDNYNHELRKVVPHQSLRPSDATVLSDAFTSVLNTAAAPASSISGLRSAVYQMATQVDTASPQPTFLATNDYTLVLQTALAVGRPMPPPILPKIAKNQGIQVNSNHIKTPLKHPTLVGTYHFHTHMQAIDAQGVVVGTTNVRRNNDYRLTIATPLSPGIYQFRIRAYDDAGHLSKVSRAFVIKVVPMRHHRHTKVTRDATTPKGPLSKSK
jgi:hypothetical protein